MRFTFSGDISFPRENSKRPFIREFEKNGRKMKSMNFGIKTSKMNMGFVELFGSQQDVIKTYDTNGDPIEVDWKDRFNEDIVSSVRRSSKHIINLGPGYEEKQFISAYDAIEYLAEELPKLNEVISVTGNVRKEFYNGQTLNKFIIKNVFAVEPGGEKKLQVNMTFFWDNEGIDVDRDKDLIYLNGYTREYIDKDTGSKYVPQQIILGKDTLIEGNERSERSYEFKKKLVEQVPRRGVAQAGWICILINGSEEIPFDESQLTPLQKESIELGLHTIDDFKPRGQIYGQRVNQLRIANIDLYRDPNDKTIPDYGNGPIDTEMKKAEFEEEIYVPSKNEKLSDVLQKAEKPVEKNSGYAKDPEGLQIDAEDLFG